MTKTHRRLAARVSWETVKGQEPQRGIMEFAAEAILHPWFSLLVFLSVLGLPESPWVNSSIEK